MPTRRQLIQKITLNSNTTGVTISNIPQNYTDLLILSSVRNVSNTGGMFVRFNNDSGANYSWRRLSGNGSAASSDTNATYGSPYNTGVFVTVCNSNDTANTFANGKIHIPNYTNSTNKTVSDISVSERNATNAYMQQTAGLWSNTSAINSITFISEGGGSFLANSTFYLYGITQVPIIRGGEVSVPGDGFKYHTFRSSSSLQVIEGGNVEYLVIAGGGGGGGANAGGGGAGGLQTGSSRLSPQVYAVTIGGGGNAGTTYSQRGTNGSDSSSFSITSTGGGGGGAYGSSNTTGSSGGSGGGGASTDPAGSAGGSGISGQGNSGGNGSFGSGARSGGGGGGSGAAGTNASNGVAGTGGSGRIVFGAARAGGGGGGAGGTGATVGVGSAGGGTGGSTVRGSDAVINSGSGGGGGGDTVLPGGAGGSGIVIIRYPYDGN